MWGPFSYFSSCFSRRSISQLIGSLSFPGPATETPTGGNHSLPLSCINCSARTCAWARTGGCCTVGIYERRSGVSVGLSCQRVGERNRGGCHGGFPRTRRLSACTEASRAHPVKRMFFFPRVTHSRCNAVITSGYMPWHVRTSSFREGVVQVTVITKRKGGTDL